MSVTVDNVDVLQVTLDKTWLTPSTPDCYNVTALVLTVNSPSTRKYCKLFPLPQLWKIHKFRIDCWPGLADSPAYIPLPASLWPLVSSCSGHWGDLVWSLLSHIRNVDWGLARQWTQTIFGTEHYIGVWIECVFIVWIRLYFLNYIVLCLDSIINQLIHLWKSRRSCKRNFDKITYLYYDDKVWWDYDIVWRPAGNLLE